MVANRAYKFRIYPNDEQKILFAKTFGCVRMVYNHWLDRKIRQYEENKTNVTYTICAKEMAAMKKTEEYGFLKEADSIALQQSTGFVPCSFFISFTISSAFSLTVIETFLSSYLQFLQA